MQSRSLLFIPILTVLLATRAPADPPQSAPKIPSPSAEMSPRDVLRRMIEPYVDVFTRDPQGKARAFSLQFRLLEATNQPPELRGSRVRFDCQPPNNLLFQFFALGTVTTISRQGQHVWAAPASRLAPILQRAEAMTVTREQQEPLATLRLPVPTKVFWLLFRLVKVRDGGETILDRQVCRRLEIDSPDKEDRGKFIRLWVRADTFQLVRLDWQSPVDHASLAVEKIDFLPSLPADDFQPDAEAKADLLEVPVSRFRPFFTLLGKEEEKRQKAARASGAAGN